MKTIVLIVLVVAALFVGFSLLTLPVPIAAAAVPTMTPPPRPHAIPPTIAPTHTAAPTGTPGPERARVIPIGLFLRVGPGVDNASVRILGQGETVKILQRVDGWAEVLAGDVTGWVNANYLQLINGDD